MEKEIDVHVQKAVEQKEAELTENMANAVMEFKREQSKKLEQLQRQAGERAEFERTVRMTLEELYIATTAQPRLGVLAIYFRSATLISQSIHNASWLSDGL